jgi:hypothetical protein
MKGAEVCGINITHAEMRNAYRILITNPVRKKPLELPRH